MRKLFFTLTIYLLVSACGSSAESVETTAADSALETAPSTTQTETTTTAQTETTTTARTETTVFPTTSSISQEQENNWSEEWEAVLQNQIDSLLVNDSGQAPVPYDRDDWGSGWGDEDEDCINTRHEVLILESLEPVTFNSSGCSVSSGYWYGAFAGTYTSFPGSFDIDHFVPLANAHHSGGWAWSSERKNAFYNDLSDPQHLIAVSASQNRSKGARGPDEWKPANTSYWCQYAFSWINIKSRWGLSVTSAELEALFFMVESCDNPPNVSGAPSLPPATTSPPTTAPPATTSPPATTPPPATTSPPTTTTSAAPSNPGDTVNCGDFSTWDEAKAWFDTYYPYYGDVARLDQDGDLNPCESLPGAP